MAAPCSPGLATQRGDFQMRIRLCSAMVMGAALAAVLCLASTPAAAQAVPRLANGKPDLSGGWDDPRVGDMSKDVRGRCGRTTPGCSSTGFKDLNSLLTPYGAAENAKAKFDYGVHCLPWGYVRSWGTPYPLEFLQNSNRLAILFERIILFT